MKPAVLFVCLGNICRSPLAEAAFRHAAKEIGLDATVDSAGIGDWHIDKPPDLRAQAMARRHGIDISGYRGRQVSAEDFRRFTHIIALDHDNLAALQRLKPRDGTAELSLLLDHVAGRAGEAVADPYYGGEKEFALTWSEVATGTAALAERIAKTKAA
jgi:protein-tyrosine phosphatase